MRPPESGLRRLQRQPLMLFYREAPEGAEEDDPIVEEP